MNADELESKLGATWRQHAIADDGRAVVIAISGGGDSCALLALVCETELVARERVVAAYFDHRLRGDDGSRAERSAVASLCARYGVMLEVGAWEAPVATEAAARQARYAFLAAVAKKHRAAVVVTGHTADDQVETVLMHAMRGAGLYGLAGMAVVSTWPFSSAAALLVRPLLALSRSDTHTYCDERAIAYVDDASNDDGQFLRNRVRAELLPTMRALAPGAPGAILRLADEARAALAAIAPVADALVAEHADGATIGRAALRGLAPELRSHVYRRAVVRLLGDARELDRRHYAILEIAHDATTGSTFELPRGIVVTVDPDAVLLSRGMLRLPAIDPDAAHSVPFAGMLGVWEIAVRAGRGGEGEVRLPEGAVVRGRRPGDRLVPRGMRGHKKLQDYYVDRKVPRRERDAAPVIAVGREVLWTPFGVIAPASLGARYAVDCARSQAAGSTRFDRERQAD